MRPPDKLHILHVILAIRETSNPYNEHCLPWVGKRDLAICTFFPSDVAAPAAIPVFEGDGTLAGFFGALRGALAAGPYDVIHVHSPHLALLFLVGTLTAHRRYAASTVLTVHDSYPNYKLRNRLMFLPAFACFRRVVCCSQASYQSFPWLYRKLAGSRLRVVQNGVDLARVDRIAARAREATRPSPDFTVTAISRLVDIKNPFTALRAFQRSDPAGSNLIHIGAGPLLEALLMASREAGLAGRVHYTGLIPREQVFEYLTHTDLFLSVSRGEGLPISVLEAMACSRPVVLSDIPPHREIAEDVSFIPLVHPDDVDGFARAIQRFRAMSPSERAEIGQACRRLVEERFSLDAMHQGYGRIYAELMGGHLPTAPLEVVP